MEENEIVEMEPALAVAPEEIELTEEMNEELSNNRGEEE